MTRTLIVALLSLAVALLSLLTALFAAFAPDIPTVASRDTERATRARADEATLLDHMVLMQRYVEKAALAADAGNGPLTEFYAQKIDERAARVVDGGYVVDGIDVSAIAAEVANPRAAALAEAAASRDSARFREAYAQMVDGCNTCHRRAGYGLIRIQRPDAARYPSQAFGDEAPPE
ncbi:cytochrome c [Rubrivirga marina]|uniref:Cytochrome c domain-containing protein n=1 Tax=Rubrivirga marina TaxID=1196024 RepID=A0A271J3K4_9BACT|nr:cytochrome c [Rubrivirga marina]PAP77858.1 hypothetical protein BSZ37_16125 [Rubrivirga marina]